MNKNTFVLIGMAICLVLVTVALFGPWYGVHSKSSDSESTANSYLTKAIIESEQSGSTTKITMDYADSEDTTGKDVFDNTMYLTITIIILITLSLIGILGVLFHFGNAKTMRNIGVIFGIIAFILAIVSISYFMIEYTNQMNEAASAYSQISGQDLPELSFWDSYSEGGEDGTLGPGYAWYFVLVAGIISLISSLIFFKQPKAIQ